MHALRSCTIPLLAFLAGICLHPHQSAADTDPTDKIHKGVLSANPDGKRDPLGLLCKFDLSYALWTLLGEPIEDYKFKWEACPESRVTWPGGQSLQHIETIHPDAAKSIAEIVPFKVIIRTEVRFYGDVAASKPFAKGILDVEPDLYSPSGKPEQLSVAESPNWDKWFHSFSFLVQEESPHSQKVDGSPGERCSQMCPRAKEVATAACTDVGDDFTQKSCTCEERGPAPYAKIEYACLIKGNPRSVQNSQKGRALVRGCLVRRMV